MAYLDESTFIESDLFASMIRSHRELVELACNDAQQALTEAEYSKYAERLCLDKLAKSSESLAIAQRCVEALQQTLRNNSTTRR